jgi:exonuclease SbcC
VLESAKSELAAVLQTCGYAREARAALETIERAVSALGYDRETHAAVQARIRALGPAEQQLEQLDAARRELHQATLEGTTFRVDLERLSAERARLCEEVAPLQKAVQDLPAARAAMQEARARLGSVRAAEGVLLQRIGALRNLIEEGARRSTERAESSEALASTEKSAWAHRELATIFGKRGIQTMLIENALPELEQDANDLLSRMTDNSTQVRFATQRQGTGGKAIETLEIQIADSMGTRTYEMFSGGEAFRINFAIRIALSKLLTRRAGTDLSFLLIDEGFGTQDEQGRDRLVEAIGAVADDFEKILVVTHIDELKDQFDVHVEVGKGPAGSHITVTAA